MRSRRRSLPEHGEVQDYLASVSDLMSGLIFLFIITLAVFALRLAEARRNLGRTQDELTNAAQVRTTVIKTLQSELEKEGVHVEVDLDQGVLRLTDRAIRFARGESRPYPEHYENVGTVANVLLRVLPCYVQTHGEVQNVPPRMLRLWYCEHDERRAVGFRCPAEARGAKVHTVLIEGHTDNVSVGRGAPYKDNLGLSAARSAEVLRMMETCEPELAGLTNRSGSPVISVSGYGDTRPIDVARRDADVNRRIDLRFLMEPPHVGAEDGRAEVVGPALVEEVRSELADE